MQFFSIYMLFLPSELGILNKPSREVTTCLQDCLFYSMLTMTINVRLLCLQSNKWQESPSLT